MALGNNPSQTDVIKAIRDLESGGSGGGVQSVTTGSTNGTISVDGTDVAVKGLGSNAFNSTPIPTSINGLGGGTLTSPLTLTGGDSATASKMILDTNGQITDTSTATLFGRTGTGSTLTIGHGSYATALRGSATRPTYNGNNMALSSDIPSTSNFVTTNTEQTISAKKEISYGSSPNVSKLVLGDKSISGNTLTDIAGISSSLGGYTGGFYVDNIYGLVLRSTDSSSNDITPRIRKGTNYYTIATTSDIPSAGTTASAVGTSASGGSASTYSKSDHVHNITSTTITTALGYTPNKTIGVTTNSSSGQAATSGYNRIRLTNVGDKALVFHKQYSTAASGTFSGSAFSTVLLAWVEQASTGDTQSQRTTLQSVTTSGWSIAGGYKHWICVIGLV